METDCTLNTGNEVSGAGIVRVGMLVAFACLYFVC